MYSDADKGLSLRGLHRESARRPVWRESRDLYTARIAHDDVTPWLVTPFGKVNVIVSVPAAGNSVEMCLWNPWCRSAHH